VNSDIPVAIVTGGNGDIGSTLVTLLIGKGFRVASLDVSKNDNISARYDAVRSNYRFFRADVTQKNTTEAAVKGVLETWGRIDCLVNCAGIFRPRPFLELTEEDWDQTIGVNLNGTFWTCQVVAPHMISSGRGGRIVNISSGLAFKAGAGTAAYASSKAGVEGLTHTLALELARHNINVNAVAPGMVQGSMVRNALGEDAMQIGANNPARRIAVPEDIAEVMAFLVSAESSYITGQIFQVNGGGLMI